MQLTIRHTGAAVWQLELDADCGFCWCHSLMCVLRCCSTRTRDVWVWHQEARGTRAVPMYYGSEGEAPGLILHLDRFTFWLPEKTWTWELVGFQSIWFCRGSGCLAHMLGRIKTTWWGRHSARVHNQYGEGGERGGASACAENLRCIHFLREETERVMMQLWNVKHARKWVERGREGLVRRRRGRRLQMQHVVRALSGVAHILLAPASKTRSLKCDPVRKNGERKKKSSQGIGGSSEGRRR